MKIDRILSILALTLSIASAGLVSTMRHEREGPPAPSEERIARLEATAPGPGDALSAAQRHIAKLYFAGQAGNWDLAKFELAEVEEGLDAAAAARAEDNGIPLAPVIQAFKNTQLSALTAAVAKRDREGFGKAYEAAVVTCNSCHQAVGRPYIRIVSPTGPPVTNQEWKPAPGPGK